MYVLDVFGFFSLGHVYICVCTLVNGVSIQRNARNVPNGRKKVSKKYPTNVADVVDGTAVLIIIDNPFRYSVVCFCNLMPHKRANSNHLLRIK